MTNSLPIDAVLPEILSHLKTQSSLIVRAEPGAGKTTRIPVALAQSQLFEKGQKILVLEPRRMAARMAAKRIAENLGCRIGSRVGYQIRFENRTSPQTQVIVMTEGLLAKRLQSDPFLEDVGCVILDEFHERSIHTDLAISFLKEIQQSIPKDFGPPCRGDIELTFQCRHKLNLEVFRHVVDSLRQGQGQHAKCAPKGHNHGGR